MAVKYICSKKNGVITSLVCFAAFILVLMSPRAYSTEASEEVDVIPPESNLMSHPNRACPDLSGQYELIGKGGAEVSKSVRTLTYILQVAIPYVAYQPNVERYAVLKTIENQKLQVTIVLGAESKSTTKNVVCDGDWVRIEQTGENRAEGNIVRYRTISRLTKNRQGDLIAQYVENISSTTLFGLLKSQHADRYELTFPMYQPKRSE